MKNLEKNSLPLEEIGLALDLIGVLKKNDEYGLLKFELVIVSKFEEDL